MKSSRVKPIVQRTCQAWRILAALVRWTAVVVFSVLFVVGLILRLPWKVLVLLAVIPVVGMFVPRKPQKWVWWALTLVAAGVYLWIFYLPKGDDSGWRTYQYTEQTDPDFLHNEHNAAVRYAEIFQEYEETVFSYPYSFAEDQTTYAGPWEMKQYPSLSQWLHVQEPILKELIDISRMPVCRFEAPIDLRSYQRQQLRIKLMKAWASVLIRASHRDLAEGDLQAALDKQLAIVGMARHLLQQGTLLDQATGYNLERSACRVLHAFLVRYSPQPSMLEEMESQILRVESNWPENWQRILQREKHLARNIAGMFYQINEQGQTRISRDLGQGLHQALGYPPYRFLRTRELSRLLVLGMWLALPPSPEQVGRMIESRFDRYARMAEAGQDLETVDTWPIWLRGLNARSVVDWYAKQQVSFYYPLQRKEIRHEALRRVTLILIELKRYRQREGVWPQRLDDLLEGDWTAGRLFDPVSGLPFVYERTGDTFRLYSLGGNRRDDGGMNNGEDQDDRLYWPQPVWEGFVESSLKNGEKSTANTDSFWADESRIGSTN